MPLRFPFLCLFSNAASHLEWPPSIQTFFILKGEALTHLFQEFIPTHVSPTSPLFLISSSTTHLSLIIEVMLLLFHSYPPAVGLVPPAVLGVPPVFISSISLRCKLVLSTQEEYNRYSSFFFLKNKPWSKFPSLYLRNGNGLENSSMRVLSLIQVVQVGKNVVFPKLTNSPSLSSESNSRNSEPSM